MPPRNRENARRIAKLERRTPATGLIVPPPIRFDPSDPTDRPAGGPDSVILPKKLLVNEWERLFANLQR